MSQIALNYPNTRRAAERAFTAAARGGVEPAPELAAWRRSVGGVVRLALDGVTLFQWERGQRVAAHFSSEAEAVAAIRRGRINWKPSNKGTRAR